MTDSGTPAAQPGWYADPAGSPRLRWWDGRQWTEYLHDPAAAQTQAPVPTVSPDTPVYNVFIWIIAFLPIVSIVTFSSFDLAGYVAQAARLQTDPGAGLPTGMMTSPGYLLIALFGWVVWLGTVLLAYFDWRKLRKDGFVRPFHWAWAFLNAGLYVIGRSIIVKRRAGHGLAPIWVWIAVMVVYLVVVAIKFVDAVSVAVSTVGSISS